MANHSRKHLELARWSHLRARFRTGFLQRETLFGLGAARILRIYERLRLVFLASRQRYSEFRRAVGGCPAQHPRCRNSRTCDGSRHRRHGMVIRSLHGC